MVEFEKKGPIEAEKRERIIPINWILIGWLESLKQQLPNQVNLPEVIYEGEEFGIFY